MALKLITAPATEPVTLTEAKAHLRVDFSDDDTYIGVLITAARQWAEEFTRRAFVTQTWDLTGDTWPAGDRIVLPLGNLQSVTSVTGTDESGTVTTVSSSSYVVDTSGEPGRIVLKSASAWPSTTVRPGGFAVRFVCGYGAAAAVPEAVKAGIKLLIGHLYENREDVVVGVMATQVPMGARALLWPYRIVGWER